MNSRILLIILLVLVISPVGGYSPPVPTGEPCTELWYKLVNKETKLCRDEVKFMVDGNPILCDGDMTLTLHPKESMPVLCKSNSLRDFCDGVHKVEISYCGMNYNFKYGILKAKILSPNEGEFIEGEYIEFSGIGEEGINTGKTYSYTWLSSIDGIISTDRSFSINNLSVGMHEITLDVTKTVMGVTPPYYKGTTISAKDTITITIKPSPLRVRIISPIQEGIYQLSEKIPFNASVTGGKRPYRWTWTSDIDGIIGDVREFSTTLSLGMHRITLSVVDSTGSTAKDNGFIFINPSHRIPSTPLMASIESPMSDEVYTEGDSINLGAFASGGKKPYTYVWTLDGRETEKIEDISAGIHRVGLRVTDSEGNSRTDYVEIRVVERCGNGICDSGENYGNCPRDCPSGLGDNYCDKIKEGRCDPDCSRTEDLDCICKVNGICEMGIENYLNCPRDCPSGLRDSYCDKEEDGVCDPDCNGRDPDCSRSYLDYVMLLILVIALIIAYTKFIRK